MVQLRNNKGQSIAEFLISLMFLVPAVLFIPTLANMLLVQTTAHKASRYVAWERTAYSAGDLKTSEELEGEVQQRFYVDEDLGFGSEPTEARVRWQDFRYRTSMVDYDSGVRMDLSASESATEFNTNASAWLATGQGSLEDPHNAIVLDTLQISKLSVPISSELSILRPVEKTAEAAWFHDRDAPLPDAPEDPIAHQNRFYVASSSALVADGWASANDAMFHDRVSGVNSISRRFQNFWENTLGLSGTLQVLGFDEIPRRLFTNPEGRRASLDMVDQEQSRNLPLQAYE
jgi:hypothetical protein